MEIDYDAPPIPMLEEAPPTTVLSYARSDAVSAQAVRDRVKAILSFNMDGVIRCLFPVSVERYGWPYEFDVAKIPGRHKPAFLGECCGLGEGTVFDGPARVEYRTGDPDIDLVSFSVNGSGLLDGPASAWNAAGEELLSCHFVDGIHRGPARMTLRSRPTPVVHVKETVHEGDTRGDNRIVIDSVACEFDEQGRIDGDYSIVTVGSTNAGKRITPFKNGGVVRTEEEHARFEASLRMYEEARREKVLRNRSQAKATTSS